MVLESHPSASYSFLPAGGTFSDGVLAHRGHECVRVTLKRELRWDEGLSSAFAWLKKQSLKPEAMCGVELRCSQPMSVEDFGAFNEDYAKFLDENGIRLDGRNPMTRTNVAPCLNPPDGIALHAFSFVRPGEAADSQFVLSGAGEVKGRSLSPENIVRFRETTDDAMVEKAQCVTDILEQRLGKLNLCVDAVTGINVYAKYPIHDAITKAVLPILSSGTKNGLIVFYAQPPVQDIEFEMDVRGVACELTVEL